jgi:hypothetical protein
VRIPRRVGPVYQAGIGVTPKGQAKKPLLNGLYRGVVINTYATDSDLNDSDYQVRCDVILVRSQVPLPSVAVLGNTGVNDGRPWTPKPTTATFSGKPLNLRVFSKRGTFEGDPTLFDDMNGDNVVVQFIEGDRDFPMIMGKMTHRRTKRIVIAGDGWEDALQDDFRDTPFSEEHYFRYSGVEARVNHAGDVLLDTVGATTDLENEIPAPTGGEVRVRLKRGQKAVIAGGSVAGEGNLGGADLLSVTQDDLGAIEAKLSDQLTIAISALGEVEINLGGIKYTKDAGGLVAVDLLGAVEPFVKGTAYSTAMVTNLVTALNTYAAALLVAPVAGAVNVASATTAAADLVTALTAFSTAVTASLSATIKGE